MPVLELTEIVAWALIVAAIVYRVLESHGPATAAMAAALAAIATKTALFSFA
jgi:hypothetical protein